MQAAVRLKVAIEHRGDGRNECVVRKQSEVHQVRRMKPSVHGNKEKWAELEDLEQLERLYCQHLTKVNRFQKTGTLNV